MARLSLVLFVCCLFIGVYVNSHVLKSEASPNQAVVSMQDDEPMVISEISDDGIIPLEVQSLDGINEEKKCAVIGEFCMNHTDCCSNSCLGFMKRCVS